MAVTSVASLDAYAQMAQQAYEPLDSPSDPVPLTDGTNYIEIDRDIDGLFGFQGRAFFNEDRNELVIAFTGTEDFPEDAVEFLPDMVSNLALAATGAAPQVGVAETFIAAAMLAATQRGEFGFDVTYVGHSLGGFLAQSASRSGPEGEVVVFNSPGAGGFLGLPQNGAFPEDRYT